MGTREQASTGFARRPSSCQPGSLNLLHYLISTYRLGNSGCYSPTSVLSSGRPSWHQYGKAVDLGCDWYDRGGDRADGDACFAWVLAHREELNLQQMIWGDRIWDIDYGQRGYHHDDHKNHIHVAIGYQASQTWHPSGSTPQPTNPQEDDMNEQQDAAVRQAAVAATGALFKVTELERQVQELVNAAYPGGDTGGKSRLRLLIEDMQDVKRALFPNGGNVTKTSRPALILQGIDRIYERLKAGTPS